MATDWGLLTVVDLRHELKQRGLSTAGKKADLVERLTAAETEKSPDNDDVANSLPAVDPNIDTQDAPTETPAIRGGGPPDPLLEVEREVVEKSETFENSPVIAVPTTNSAQGDADAAPVLNSSYEPEVMDSASAHISAVDDSTEDNKVNPISATTTDELSPDLSKDARGRKRRSRTPPPSDDESSRKRTRPNEQHDESEGCNLDDATLVGEEVLPLDDDPASKDSSYAKLLPDNTTTEPHGSWDLLADGTKTATQLDDGDVSSQTAPGEYMEDISDVEPSIHPATSALYIKNLMRPLKEAEVRNHLVILATPPGRTPNPDIVEEFFLDTLRTHAFVRFQTIAAASRVRVKLHTKVWPEERARRALWVDFAPPGKIVEWIEMEIEGSSRRQRGEALRKWEVVYEQGENGSVKVELVDMAGRDNTRNVRVPTGPARQFSGVDGAPSGPRGHGAFRDFDGGRGGDGILTSSSPRIFYQPVSDDLAQRRLRRMRSFYTSDRHRDMGRYSEINRYTFQNGDLFVDRGVELNPGIRPLEGAPRRRPRRRHGPQGFRPRGDRYYGGLDRGVPRSRFDGAPMPTWGGSGNPGGRPHYWGHR